MDNKVNRSAIAVSLVIFFIIYLYVFGDNKSGILAQTRGLNDVFELWRFGYLRAFFHFDYFSFNVILALPLFFIIFIFWQDLEIYVKLPILLLVMSLIVVGKLGYFNYRYAFTIVPILVALPCFLWGFFQTKIAARLAGKTKYLKGILLLILTILASATLSKNYKRIDARVNQIVNQKYSKVIDETLTEWDLIEREMPTAKVMSVRFKHLYYYSMEESRYIFDYGSFLNKRKQEADKDQYSLKSFVNSNGITHIVVPNSLIRREGTFSDLYYFINKYGEQKYRNRYASIYIINTKEFH
ncbi:MAG: hypothetical protein GJ680_05090 [Alteromonadaceae bacterium]|nr:hypothetical protein [Alteromonadaceae bacterium]